MPPRWDETPLLKIRAVRDLAWLFGIALTVGLLWVAHAVTIPVFLAFTGAVVIDPLVAYAERRGLPRATAALLAVVLVLLGTVGILAVGLPPLIVETRTLITALPEQLAQVQLPWGFGRLVDVFRQNGSGSPLDLAKGVEGPIAWVAGTLAQTGFLWLLTAYATAVFVYFSVHLPKIRRLDRYFDPRISDLMRQVMTIMESYIRGQILVAVWFTVVFGVGFTWVRVPYGLVAAVVGGVLSLVPSGQAAGAVLAVLFGTLAEFSGADRGWLAVIVYPALIYTVAQVLETFFITPLVQGTALSLHPLVVLGAAITGGAVGGVVGLFFAIPVTALGYVLLKRWVIPALERRAHAAQTAEAVADR